MYSQMISMLQKLIICATFDRSADNSPELVDIRRMGKGLVIWISFSNRLTNS